MLPGAERPAERGQVRLDAPASRSRKAGNRIPAHRRGTWQASPNLPEVTTPAWNIRSEWPGSPTSTVSRPSPTARQVVYLPQASIFVAEKGRDLSGGVVMALRPSVRSGGFIGSIDLLVVDPD